MTIIYAQIQSQFFWKKKLYIIVTNAWLVN